MNDGDTLGSAETRPGRNLDTACTVAGAREDLEQVTHALATMGWQRTAAANDNGILEAAANLPKTRFDRGSTIGKFKILGFIGEGGMGSVYRALDKSLQREVALKTVDTRSVEEHNYAISEARTMARMKHPNIGEIHELHEGVFGDPNNPLYFIQELIPGTPLHHQRRKGPMRQQFVRRQILPRLLSGLSSMHAKGVCHLDLKGGNVMYLPPPDLVERLRRAGEGEDLNLGPLLKIIDFGIAQRSEDGKETFAPGGTPGYMALEQMILLPVDKRTDIYAFGGILYEMLSGNDFATQEAARKLSIVSNKIHTISHTPESIASWRGEVTRVWEEAIAPVQERLERPLDDFKGLKRGKRYIARAADEFLREIIRRSISRAPEDRYADCENILDELNEFQRRILTRKNTRRVIIGGGIATMVVGLGSMVYVDLGIENPQLLAEAIRSNEAAYNRRALLDPLGADAYARKALSALDARKGKLFSETASVDMERFRALMTRGDAAMARGDSAAGSEAYLMARRLNPFDAEEKTTRYLEARIIQAEAYTAAERGLPESAPERMTAAKDALRELIREYQDPFHTYILSNMLFEEAAQVSEDNVKRNLRREALDIVQGTIFSIIHDISDRKLTIEDVIRHEGLEAEIGELSVEQADNEDVEKARASAIEELRSKRRGYIEGLRSEGATNLAARIPLSLLHEVTSGVPETKEMRNLALMYLQLGSLYRTLNQFDFAESCYQVVAGIAADQGNEYIGGVTESYRGILDHYTGDAVSAEKRMRSAIRTLESWCKNNRIEGEADSGIIGALGKAHETLANILYERDVNDDTLEHVIEAEKIFRALHNNDDLVTTMLAGVNIHIARGEYDIAQEKAEEGIDLAEQLNKKADIGYFTSLLGDIAFERGEYDLAQGYFSTVIEKFDPATNAYGTYAFLKRALCRLHLGDEREAEVLLTQGLKYGKGTYPSYTVPLAAIGLAEGLKDDGQYQEALELLLEAEETRPNVHFSTLLRAEESLMYALLQQPEASARTEEEAARIAEDANLRYAALNARLKAGEAQISLGTEMDHLREGYEMLTDVKRDAFDAGCIGIVIEADEAIGDIACYFE